MTVMLLQRSSTPQLTQSQKTADNNNSNDELGTPAPCLILLDIQESSELERASYPSFNNNNNNNNSVNNNRLTEKQDRKNVAVIGRSSTCGSGSGAGAVPTKLPTPARNCEPPVGIAMRYYRLWIYACNIVLFGCAVGFVAALSKTFFFPGDIRRYLVPGIPRYYDPTALFAYLSLTIQLGVVQLVGCIAARKLSTRLLNAYWVMLLALLFGDVFIGVVWVFRFERMRAELRPTLRQKLQVDYGKDTSFSEEWDQLQREFSCCGVTGPKDFGTHWPSSCCTEPVSILNVSSSITITSTVSTSNNNTIESCQETHTNGCEDFIQYWMRKTADFLFVIGFCVIAFAKLCFLGILRYEIREMIQKIRLMQEPPPPTIPFIQSLCQSQPSLHQLQQLPPHHHHHHHHHHLTEPPINGNVARRTTLPIVTAHAISGTRSLLMQAEDSINTKHPLLSSNLQDTGGDSDTNSHCALILEESTPPAVQKNNSNNNYEMRELNRRLLLSNGANPSVQSSSNVPTGSDPET